MKFKLRAEFWRAGLSRPAVSGEQEFRKGSPKSLAGEFGAQVAGSGAGPAENEILEHLTELSPLWIEDFIRSI